MAYRFGRSHWQDTDRLNLMLVCQQHQQWDQRLAAMREIYPPSKYPPGYFTENSCREELERLMSLPTPNLRLDVSTHFVFSRKIMIEKWVEHLTAEVRKQQNAQTENALVGLRSNGKLLKEVLDPNTPSKRIEEIIKSMTPLADRHKNDVNFKRTVGSLDAAITERMKTGDALDLDSLVLPATNPAGDDVPSGTNGFLTPTHPMSPVDCYFSPMLSLAEAVREAAPVPVSVPEEPDFMEPVIPAPVSTEIPIPDDILEPLPPTPKKEEEPRENEEEEVEKADETRKAIVENEEVEEKAETIEEKVEVQHEKQEEEEIETKTEKKDVETAIDDIPAVSSKHSKQLETPQKPAQRATSKKAEEVPLEVKLEEATIKEEGEDATPSPSVVRPVVLSRPRGRPRIVSRGSQPQRPVRSQKKTEEGKFQHALGSTPSSRRGLEAAAAAASASSTTPTTAASTTSSSEQPSASATSRSSRRNKESSQDPPTSSSRSKKTRHVSVANSARKRKEGTEEPVSSSKGSSVPPVLRSESSFDVTTAPGSPVVATYREIEVQTDITIRQTVYETPMGERRRTNLLAPPVRKGRKSHLPTDNARSTSRNSSASTPAPRAGSTGLLTFKSTACQTSQRFDLDKEDVVLIRVEARPKYVCCINELGIEKKIVVNEETCKEINAENAALGENSIDIGKRAAKVDGKREMTFIVETDESIAQRLIEEKGYQVMSASCDLPSSNDSPVKRYRRDERTREDANNIKYQLLTMHRAIIDCEWAEQFRKPVPLSEEGYDETIKFKVDLSQIKKDIENGVITSVTGFLLRAYRMLANAIMFNSHDHEVAVQAKAIMDNVMGDITSLVDEERRAESAQRRGRTKDANKDISRSGSMEPEPMTPLGDVGNKRSVFRKAPTNDQTMTTLGNRKSKKSLK